MSIAPEALVPLFETIILPEIKAEETLQEPAKPRGEREVSLIFSGKPEDEEMNFIRKVLASVHLMEEDAEKFYHVSEAICREIIESGNGKFLVWGIPLQDLKWYTIYEIHGNQVFLSEDISLIKDEREKKLSLWEGLKRMFPEI